MKKIIKEFNIDDFKTLGVDVLTRDGKKVQHIEFVRLNENDCIIAVIDGIKYVYRIDGKINFTNNKNSSDLILYKTEFEDGDIVTIHGVEDRYWIFKYRCLVSKYDAAYYALINNFGEIYYNYTCNIRNAELATKEERNLFYSILKGIQSPMFKPFDKVIVRNSKNLKWKTDFFSYIDNTESASFPFVCTGGPYIECVPYNNTTKYLIGTTENFKYKNENN